MLWNAHTDILSVHKLRNIWDACDKTWVIFSVLFNHKGAEKDDESEI